jgi:hypothetical protein
MASPTISTTADFPEPIVEWLAGYGIDVPRALSVGLRYAPSTNQLIFNYVNKENEQVCTQARNFDPHRKARRKYDTTGSSYESFHIIRKRSEEISPEGTIQTIGMGDHRSDVPTLIVLTEDLISAIKVSEVCDAIPCLGTSFQTHKIGELRNRGYQEVVVWLDKDKWREARHIADTCKWLGLSSRALLTDLDPKEYSVKQIKEYLQ